MIGVFTSGKYLRTTTSTRSFDSTWYTDITVEGLGGNMGIKVDARYSAHARALLLLIPATSRDFLDSKVL